MLHRMTTLLSTVVAVSLAALVLDAVFPIAARAADNCFARPTGNPPDGSRWFFQTNHFTRQKCRVTGPKRIRDAETAIVRDAVFREAFNLTSFNALAAPATAGGCIHAPKGPASRRSRWHYHTDAATGQRCWWRSGRISKARFLRAHFAEARVAEARIFRMEVSRNATHIIPASSPEPANLAAAQTPPAALRQAAADAGPELLDEFNVPARRIETAALPVPGMMEATNKNAAAITFASRWGNLLDPAPSADRWPGPPAKSQFDRPVPAVFSDVNNSSTAGEHLFAAERSLYVTVIVFLAALVAALVVFGLIGIAFIYMRARYARSAPPGRPNPPPEGGISSNGGPPDPLRPNGFTRNVTGKGDPSSPHSPSAVKPIHAGDRPVRQFDDVECCS